MADNSSVIRSVAPDMLKSKIKTKSAITNKNGVPNKGEQRQSTLLSSNLQVAMQSNSDPPLGRHSYYNINT